MEFEEIYLKYSPQIFRVCMGYINDHEAAKDLTQETFISVWKNLDSFKNQSKISTWIFRIATNNCLRAIEKSKRVTVEELPLNLADKLEENNDAQLAFLYNCIAELEETERIIISLVLEDLSRDEIASIVGLSSVNTRVKIHRIKEKLAQKFKQHGQFE
ncbi:RNA polymerase sigma factor [Mucilaginibacter sp. X4EP1]|jgi:RNA polymerase sigma-70 factor, ECF subfamily|uniref:RNA polymerase sigma factor n=1 Tax=Mucilaginibacter sp. X4EP1 TaxID=2723092 RepID=UPI002167E820|nr:sigma-70 family RNA polymerase sigma factor [Mucilaginibacter sp. X4EP1]MCS3816305.1 RNA polymerase sigma-70 factor (ECF subfamily) [Mucilaginibacter sp. X4EP1]